MKIALVGNPNAGKSSVFNHLTGLKQKTGNFPGVTVDKRTGKCALPDGSEATVVDLPGAYSLYPNSMDERIVADVLLDKKNPACPDLVVYIADANNLERHLLLCSQLADLEIPLILALTMSDIAGAKGMQCNTNELAALLGTQVVKVNGRTGSGVKDLVSSFQKNLERKPNRFMDVSAFAPAVIDAIRKKHPDENDYRALLLAHHFRRLAFLSESQKTEIGNITAGEKFQSLPLQVQETLARYEKIDGVLAKVLPKKTAASGETLTEKIDKVLTHRIFGSLIFLAVLFIIFQAIFSWAAYPMEWIDEAFGQLSAFAKHSLPSGLLSNLLSEGIIPGIAGICIFIPQITILFALIVFLEDIGYMSRAIFLSDHLMRQFGLNGRSVVSLFSGVACAVPAIMATRTISNWKERLITIMVTPLISCSARIPVYTILVALALPNDSHIWIFNAKGILMMGLYLLGASAALGAAFVMKKIIKSSEHSYLVMEMPSYKMPHWKNIAFTVADKVKIFVTEAGKVILLISIVLWFLASYGPKQAMKEAEAVPANATALSAEQRDNLIAAQKLEASYAGQLGRAIEPVIRPLGFDWKIGIALITSFAAREVFVGTIATLYSVGRNFSDQTILEKLRAETNPQTGELTFRPAVALSLLIFYVFALQCMSTLAVVKRETKSWKWAALQFIYMTALAYVASFAAFQIANALALRF